MNKYFTEWTRSTALTDVPLTTHPSQCLGQIVVTPIQFVLRTLKYTQYPSGTQNKHNKTTTKFGHLLRPLACDAENPILIAHRTHTQSDLEEEMSQNLCVVRCDYNSLQLICSQSLPDYRNNGSIVFMSVSNTSSHPITDQQHTQPFYSGSGICWAICKSAPHADNHANIPPLSFYARQRS